LSAIVLHIPNMSPDSFINLIFASVYLNFTLILTQEYQLHVPIISCLIFVCVL